MKLDLAKLLSGQAWHAHTPPVHAGMMEDAANPQDGLRSSASKRCNSDFKNKALERHDLKEPSPLCNR